MSAVNREKYMRGKRIAIDHLNDDLRSRLLHSKGSKKEEEEMEMCFCVCVSVPPPSSSSSSTHITQQLVKTVFKYQTG